MRGAGKNLYKGLGAIALLTAHVGGLEMPAIGAPEPDKKEVPSGIVLRELDKRPDGASVQDIVLRVKESENSNRMIERKGRFIYYKDALATVVISHGFMCDKFDVGFLRNLFSARHHVNSLTFDFRGHGENAQGQSCTFGRDEAYEVLAAAHFVKNHPICSKKPLFAYGFSMGAVASIEAQAKEPLFDAMILDCPFDSSANVVKKCLENIRFSLFGYEFHLPGRSMLERYAFHPYVQSMIKVLLKTVSQLDPRHTDLALYPLSPAQSIKKVSVPCFFIHCKHDEKISVSAIKNIYEAAAGPKMLWITNGRRHFDSYFYNPEKYVEQVRRFVEQVLKGQWEKQKESTILEDEDDLTMG
jgi:pimeloyl-ACP methyl ester carboxylesterase